MTRAFIVTLDLDPSVDPNLVAKELLDAVSGEFPEILSVKPWAQHDAPTGPRPIEGEMLMGQMPQ
jgi:hypothetical protein